MQPSPSSHHARDPLDAHTRLDHTGAIAPQALAKIILATSLISCLELFDFTVFGLFAAVIGDQFFPSSNPLTSLMLAAGTFAVGFLTRPIGALWIGRYADRVGRRAAMLATSWIMAIGTAAIAACPPFAVLGIGAPCVILVARVLQGIAAGGEIGAAASYAMEAVHRSRRGFVVGWQLAGQGAAALLGACLGLILTHTMTAASFAAWGWRVPFVIGLLIIPVAVYVRRGLPELPVADATRAADAAQTSLYREHGVSVLLATLMMLWRTIPVYAVVYYMPSYLTRVTHLPAIVGFRASALSALILVVIAPISGRLADRLRRIKPLLLAMSGITTVLVYPVFWVTAHAHSQAPVLLSIGLISVFIALGASAGTVLVLEQLPTHVRARGIALSYALGVALFGGTAQFVVTALIKATGDPMSITWYVAPACFVSFCAVALFRERRADPAAGHAAHQRGRTKAAN